MLGVLLRGGGGSGWCETECCGGEVVKVVVGGVRLGVGGLGVVGLGLQRWRRVG